MNKKIFLNTVGAIAMASISTFAGINAPETNKIYEDARIYRFVPPDDRPLEFTNREAYLLAKLAMAEAEDQGTEGKALVMLVVLNRVNNQGFPDTIEEVIYQKNQFAPISNGRFDKVEPDDECWEALNWVSVAKWDGSKGALYFENNGQNTWHSRNLQLLFNHKNLNFYNERGEK